MSGNMFLVDPGLRKIEAITHVGGVDYGMLTDKLGRYSGAHLELYVIDERAIALDETGRRVKAPLVLAVRRQPGVPEADPDAYKIGAQVYSGRALIACRIRGADRFYQFPSAPTGLLRTTLTMSEVEAIVDWRRTPEEVKRDQRYDEPVLREYCQRLAQGADDAAGGNHGTGGTLRVYSADLDGVVSGAINVLPGDWKMLRRWALDAFDRRENSFHEWCLRDLAPYGSSAETRPLKSLATISDEPIAGAFALRSSDGDVFVRPEVSAWPAGATPRRLSFPGLPLFRQLSDPRDDVIVRLVEDCVS